MGLSSTLDFNLWVRPYWSYTRSKNFCNQWKKSSQNRSFVTHCFLLVYCQSRDIALDAIILYVHLLPLEHDWLQTRSNGCESHFCIYFGWASLWRFVLFMWRVLSGLGFSIISLALNQTSNKCYAGYLPWILCEWGKRVVQSVFGLEVLM